MLDQMPANWREKRNKFRMGLILLRRGPLSIRSSVLDRKAIHSVTGNSLRTFGYELECRAR